MLMWQVDNTALMQLTLSTSCMMMHYGLLMYAANWLMMRQLAMMWQKLIMLEGRM